jgi:DNA-directed RNA polymerase specialized sigma subunit
MEKSIKNVENANMVNKIAWSFYNTTGIPFEDLQSEAFVAYYEGLQSYDNSKGAKVSSFLYCHVTNHLTNYCKKEKLRTTTSIEVKVSESDDESFEIVNESLRSYQPEEFNVNEMFSGKSLELVTMVIDMFNSPAKIIRRTKGRVRNIELNPVDIDLKQAPRNIRGQLADHLRNEGWSSTAIWNTFAEIRTVLNEN